MPGHLIRTASMHEAADLLVEIIPLWGTREPVVEQSNVIRL